MLVSSVLFSCKKDSIKEETNPLFKIPSKAMTLPGQSATESYLVPQLNGTYTVAYQGNMTFGTIPHKTSNFINGEAVEEINIVDDGQYISIQTVGPYFTVIRPTFVGPIAPVQAQFDAFATAYGNFIHETRDANNTLLQPFLPNLEDYVPNTSNGNGQIVSTGMIVMSNSSPSLMSVVSASFVPPVNPNPPTSTIGYLGKVRASNGIYYYCKGGSGNITEVYTIVNGVEVPFTTFSGYYLVTRTGITNINLTIYPGTSNEEFIVQNAQ